MYARYGHVHSYMYDIDTKADSKKKTLSWPLTGLEPMTTGFLSQSCTDLRLQFLAGFHAGGLEFFLLRKSIHH